MQIRVSAACRCWVLLLSMTGVAFGEDNEDSKVRNGRRAIISGAGVVSGAGVMMIGAATLNPFTFAAGSGLVGVGAGGLTRSAISNRTQRKQAQRDRVAGTTSTVAGQVESLQPVPQRPGYFYYPSNPNQLYYSQPPATEPMQTQIAPPVAPVIERISVRIANPSKVGPAIDCTVNGTPFSIPSGMVLSVTATRQAVISYDRGDRPEPDRYTLYEGDYEFRPVDKGRGLYRLNQPLAVATVPSDAKTPAQGASVPR